MIILDEAKKIIKQLEENGFEAFFVGGCVRDYVLNKKAKDWDITTNALPEDIKKIFDNTIDTGIEHGTVTVVLNKKNFEVTTYRIDGEYCNFRHPKQVFFSDKIYEDLSRRDFTINAIAFNEEKGFVDPFFGLEDIKKRIIKGVGEPNKRFNEDALRMLRAIRFSAQLGFKIEEKTFLAIKDNAHLIKNISVERIREEFVKLISSKHIKEIVNLKSTGILDFFLPEIDYFFDDNFEKNLDVLKNLNKDYVLILVFLFKDLGYIQTESILKRLKFDNNTIKQVKSILKNIDIKLIDNINETRRLMSKIDPNILKKIVLLNFAIALSCKNLFLCKTLENVYDEINEVILKKQCFCLKDLNINGEDLKNIGITNGIEIGKILNDCLNLVVLNPSMNKKETLLQKVKKTKLSTSN